MANPQAENGHTDIANDVLDALARIRIPGEARQILDFIIRKTWGWHKKKDLISLSQFSEGTGLEKPHISHGLGKLLAMNLITRQNNLLPKKAKHLCYLYGFNKNYDTWIPLPKKATLPKKAKKLCRKRVPQKKLIQKKKEYTPLFEKFWTEYPNHKSGKSQASKSYEKAIKKNGPDLHEMILASIAQHKKHSWDDPKFIPHATTWLNQERWEAELETKSKSATEGLAWIK